MKTCFIRSWGSRDLFKEFCCDREWILFVVCLVSRMVRRLRIMRGSCLTGLLWLYVVLDSLLRLLILNCKLSFAVTMLRIITEYSQRLILLRASVFCLGTACSSRERVLFDVWHQLGFSVVNHSSRTWVSLGLFLVYFFLVLHSCFSLFPVSTYCSPLE